MTNIALAAELHKLAAHLEAQPEVEIGRFYLTNSWSCSASQIKAIARAFPRPLTKRITSAGTAHERIRMDGPLGGDFSYWFDVERAKVCRLIKPAQEAVYECEPLLSPKEEAAL